MVLCTGLQNQYWNFLPDTGKELKLRVLEPTLANSPSTWTSKGQEESCLPNRDLNNNRSVPFEWKPHKQEGSIAGKRCAGRTPFAGPSNKLCLFCEYLKLCYIFLNAVYWHLSYFVCSLVGTFYMPTKMLSISDTFLSIVKTTNQPSQTTQPKSKQHLCWFEKILWKFWVESLVKCVHSSLNLQQIFCLEYLLSAWRASGVGLWAQKINPGQEFSLGRHCYSIPSNTTNRKRALGHTANLKNTIISKTTVCLVTENLIGGQ